MTSSTHARMYARTKKNNRSFVWKPLRDDEGSVRICVCGQLKNKDEEWQTCTVIKGEMCMAKRTVE